LFRLLAVAVALGVTATAAPGASFATATIDGSITHQHIDGFGFSEAFGRSAVMHGSQGLSAQHQREVADLLLSPSSGAGLSILRLGIGSTAGSSIEPTDPGGPSATPKYVWNHDDQGQVWLAQQAKARGVSRFYADAWSAPGYMKTNGDESNGGTLCGLAGASCAGGDWRRAYADYLVQYTKFYVQEGIKVTDLGFTNEPDYTTAYSSMRLTPAQATEFAKVVGPAASAAGLNLACCDATGWSKQRDYTAAITADAQADSQVKVHTGHSYSSAVTGPLPTTRKTWMSEWGPTGSTWSESWDDGSASSGITVAQTVHTALTTGGVAGYLYWYGASTGATRALIQLDGDAYHVSKRLWAIAGYSRFVRPGAQRINATSGNSALRLTAFRNIDGSLVVVALNTASSAASMSYVLANTGITAGSVTPYLTNSGNSMAAEAGIKISGGAFAATVPARSLITYRIPAGG
jgi:glucosylceramidase